MLRGFLGLPFIRHLSSPNDSFVAVAGTPSFRKSSTACVPSDEQLTSSGTQTLHGYVESNPG